MKVLITGMTGLQLGRPGRYDLTTFAKLLPEMFSQAGHEVDQRAVVPGEPLGDYDVVLVGLVGPASMTGRNDYRYGAFDAIGRAHAEGCGLGLFLEGHVRKIDTDLRYLLGGRHRLNSGMDRSRYFEWAEANLDYLLGVVQWLATEPWPATLVARFNWGDPSMLVPMLNGLTAERLVSLDPTALVPPCAARAYDQGARQPAWVLATFSDQSAWLGSLGLKWPVYKAGVKKLGQPQVPETDVIAAYGTTAGSLVWPYEHAGDGWWRTRVVFASRMGAVIYADPREVSELGEVFAYAPRQIEAMTPDERQNLAAWQSASSSSGGAWSIDQLVHEADMALKRIAAGG